MDNDWMDKLRKALLRTGHDLAGADESSVLDSAMDIAVRGCILPTVITEFPLSLSTTFITDGHYAKRAELFIAGMEIANIGCDIHDADDLHYRYSKTLDAKQQMGLPHHEIDECLIQNYLFGVPPMVGAGIGIDRLVMLLTGQTDIANTILYPDQHSKNARGGQCRCTASQEF
jgi:lysyl-tRNA synthetase class II